MLGSANGFYSKLLRSWTTLKIKRPRHGRFECCLANSNLARRRQSYNRYRATVSLPGLATHNKIALPGQRIALAAQIFLSFVLFLGTCSTQTSVPW